MGVNHIFTLLKNKIERKNYKNKAEIVEMIETYLSYGKLNHEEYKILIDLLKKD